MVVEHPARLMVKLNKEQHVVVRNTNKIIRSRISTLRTTRMSILT